MININILLSWNQCINEWISLLKSFIQKSGTVGLYILGDIWTKQVDDFDNLTILENININKQEYINFIKLIDHIDHNEQILKSVTKHLLDLQIINKVSSDMSSTSTESYRILINNIHKSHGRSNELSDEFTKQVYSILKNIDVGESFISDYDKTMPHGSIVTRIHIHIIKKLKKDYLLEPYKKLTLGLTSKSYESMSSLTINPIQKINYLIHPFLSKESKETKKNAIDITMSDQVVEYNIFPLISPIEAIKFGPISFTNSGLTKQLINRFRTITVHKLKSESESSKIGGFDSVPKSIHDSDSGSDSDSDSSRGYYYGRNDDRYVYNGLKYQQIKPVNFKNSEWNPLDGSNFITYKYNDLLSKVILSNMKINKLPSNVNKKQTIVSSNSLINKRDASKLCFEEIHKLLIRKLVDLDGHRNRAIMRELYLMQYFNVNKANDLLRHRDYNSVEVIPVTNFMVANKLI
jgi:hypothetical protein